MKMILGVAGCGLPRYRPCPSSKHNGTVSRLQSLGGGLVEWLKQ
jgi:hypothetical protein